MKKTLTIAAAALFSVSAFAQTVSSANVVGYVKLPTPPAGGFNLLALTQFSDGSTNNAYDIQSVIGNLDALNSAGLGSATVGADKLYVYTGAGYDSYALFDDGAGNVYWAATGEAGWQSGLEFLGVNAAVTDIPRGTACWLETGAGGTATNAISSGDVLNDDTYALTVPTGFSLLAYPYSSSVNLTNLVVDGAVGAGVGTATVGADKLYVYTGAGYDSYALFDDGAGNKYWASTGEAGWQSGLEFLGVNPANVDINMGDGIWFQTDAGKTITFHKIYTID